MLIDGRVVGGNRINRQEVQSWSILSYKFIHELSVAMAPTRHARIQQTPDPETAALNAFFRMADAWDLRVAEQRALLGDPPSSTFYKWKRERRGALGRDTLERISYLLGIWKDLQILLPGEHHADAWIRRANSAVPFGGRSALERMLSGNVADLYEVRRYLDAQRG